MHTKPFLILAMPRSRSYWLSQFLSTPERPCAHDPSIGFADRNAMETYLHRPNGAAVDTALALRWDWVHEAYSSGRGSIIVLTRPIAEVKASLQRLGLTCPDSWLRRLERELSLANKYAAIDHYAYENLNDEWSVRDLWSRCHRTPFPVDKWHAMAPINLQRDIPEMQRRLLENDLDHSWLFS